MKRVRYLKDMRGRVVKAPEYRQHLTGDERPDGKAAQRRRKQMARQAAKDPVWDGGCDCGYGCPPGNGCRAIEPEATQAAVAEELTRTWMVIIDEAGPVPRAAWDALYTKPEGGELLKIKEADLTKPGVERAKRRLDEQL